MNSTITMRLAALGAAAVFALTLSACTSEEPAPKPSSTTATPTETPAPTPTVEAPVEDYGTREGTWLEYAASDVTLPSELTGTWGDEMANSVATVAGDQLYAILSDRTPLGPLPRTFEDYAGITPYLRNDDTVQNLLFDLDEGALNALVPTRLDEDSNVYDPTTGALLLEASDQPDVWALKSAPTLTTTTDEDLTNPGVIVTFELTRTMVGTLNGAPAEVTLNRTQQLLMRQGDSGWEIDNWSTEELPA